MNVSIVGLLTASLFGMTVEPGGREPGSNLASVEVEGGGKDG